MTERHISLPKPFSGGDVKEWFQKFEICSVANAWGDIAKAHKLPTLLKEKPWQYGWSLVQNSRVTTRIHINLDINSTPLYLQYIEYFGRNHLHYTMLSSIYNEWF